MAIENSEFQEALATKRHKEILSAITYLQTVIENEEKTEAFEEVIETINSIKESIQSPLQDEIMTELKNISSTLEKILKKNTKKDWSIFIYRNTDGSMESLRAVENN